MTIADEHLEALMNIESAIVTVYKKHVNLRDSNVARSLDALINLYRAESRGHNPKKSRLQESEALIFDYVRNVCESMLGREKIMIKVPNAIDEKTVDEILTCLR